MNSDDYLNARQVHVGRSQCGSRGLFDEHGMMVMLLGQDENPEILARSMGWRLIGGELGEESQ